MWNEPTQNQLNQLPKLYETEETPLKDKRISMHFFLHGCDWYAAEFDGQDLFFGYVILNGDRDMAEWGYFSLRELKQLKDRLGLEVDRDLHWRPMPASQIPGVKVYD
ncbi:MAG: DUF2958 domain-containing protein [Proteobacteria bacterium]|nr:DUF2958 domain-containing protein [Pseudomonadota bacterium]